MLTLTEKGPVAEWVERIADIARETDLQMDNICWQGSPAHIACNIIQNAESSGMEIILQCVVAGKL